MVRGGEGPEAGSGAEVVELEGWWWLVVVLWLLQGQGKEHVKDGVVG